jgi:hypothetical protein
MAELLRSFDEPIAHSSGVFLARVAGRYATDGMWEGWLEFVPASPGTSELVVSPVESRQPALEHLKYWAEGLTVVYAEGALDRALHPIVVRARVADSPFSDRPARRIVTTPERRIGPEPVLDPFDVGSRNLEILRQELHALDRARLLNIIDAYALNPVHDDLTAMSNEQLITFIVVSVDAQLAQRVRLGFAAGPKSRLYDR